MFRRIDRREFLNLTAGTVLALPAVLPSPSESSNATQPSGEQAGASATLRTITPGAATKEGVDPAGAQLWDYIANPVLVNGETPSNPTWCVHGYPAACAFDGYGAQGANPAAVRGWHASPPSPGAPARCDIDYGKPVAVTAFVHYCYVPNSRDLRYFSPAPSAFRQVRIAVRQTDRDEWTVVATLADLPGECPQVLPITAPTPARYWRLEILELTAGAEMVMAYEIETYTNGVPKVLAVPDEASAIPVAFANHVLTHHPSIGRVRGAMRTAPENRCLHLSIEHGGRMVQGELQVLVDGHPLAVTVVGPDKWQAALPHGDLLFTIWPTHLGIMLDCVYKAHTDQAVAYQRVLVQVRTAVATLYYMPAYVWSSKRVDTMVNAANVQTRFAALGTKDMMLCLVPGTDRGTLGFGQDALQNDLLLGPHPTPLLLTAIAGDWWDAYRMVVRDIYSFKEQPQTVSVSDIQYGTSRYMLLSDDVWEPNLGTVQSWGDRGITYGDVGYVDLFAFYGVPYSLPAYWARYVMSGEALALERCKCIVHWLCHSGVRVQNGPARGAFFSSQRFLRGEARRFDKVGVTQAGKQVLTSHATGAILWALLYYRAVSVARGISHDLDLDQAIDEAATWLLKSQLPNGWWPYGFDATDGKPTEEEPSSASIWNVWALWRQGKQTGDKRYLDAAERGKQWFAKKFVTEHHYHGYWEDLGPSSHEGYDAAIAAVAFGDMGDHQLVLQTAKDAVQWIFTRQIECRDSNASAGLVAEQTGWPPGAYCNPMMGLAAWNAWQVSHDPFWTPFAMIPKALGWWYQPDDGSIVWTVDAVMMAPIVGPSYDDVWNDWNSAQVGALTLRWLIREVNRRSGGVIRVDEEQLRGTLLGHAVSAWSPQGGMQPVVPSHGQVNWLSFRGETQLFLVLFNHGEADEVGAHLNSRNINGVVGAETWPIAVHRIRDGRATTHSWNGAELVALAPGELVILTWGYAR